MPYVASIGTYLPDWGEPQHRVADDDAAEVHDYFTRIEMISYEDLGFAERFGACNVLEAKETTIGGAIPVTILEGPSAHGR